MSGSTTRDKATLLTRVALLFSRAHNRTSLTSAKQTSHEASKRPASFLLRLCNSPAAPALIGLLAFFSVVLSLDLADECRWTFSGPGLTFDENLNTAGGVYIVESMLEAGLGCLHPLTLNEIFNSPNYFPDYPPLGRLPLGVSNAVLGRLLGTGEHPFYLITYARVGSAIAWGLLIWLIAGFTRRRAGQFAGLAAGIFLWLTPRAFGHAHLACVETMMNLTYAACVVMVLEVLSNRKSLTARDGLLPGLMLGLALLTKIQAIFLPPVIVIWMLWNWRMRAILPLIVLGLTSFVVFMVGWPWLWNDPVGRFIAYFAQTTDRATLYCYYFGERYTDKNVPWHYPFVLFLITTPLPMLILGGWGMWLAKPKSERSVDHENTQHFKALTLRQNQFLLGVFWLPLIVFAIPGVPVYDGGRLFLVVWPIFAIWAGIAASQVYAWLGEEFTPALQKCVAATAILFPLVSFISLQPCQLSAYNILVGGLRGANKLGMERCYWGDAVTPGFLQDASPLLPQGSRLGVAPILHPLLPKFMAENSWLLHRPDLEIVAYDDRQPDNPRYVLLIHRDADPWTSLTPPPPGTRVLKQITRQGVVLAELLELLELPE